MRGIKTAKPKPLRLCCYENNIAGSGIGLHFKSTANIHIVCYSANKIAKNIKKNFACVFISFAKCNGDEGSRCCTIFSPADFPMQRIRNMNTTLYKKRKRPASLRILSLSAEAGGFEPPVRLPVRQFSKLLVSATHPNFLKKVNI